MLVHCRHGAERKRTNNTNKSAGMLGLVYLILFNRICCVVGGSQIQIQARSYQFCLGENFIDSLAIGLWPPINDPFS